MDLGIGLPATIPGVEPRAIPEWARRAEQAGFSSVGIIDRLVYANYEPLIALTAAAVVTERIRLTTTVLLATLRSAALLAKQAASVDQLSSGRLVLGLGLGGRDDDFAAMGLETKGRGRRFEAQLEEMKRIWVGESKGYAGAIGPPPARDGGPELILGGHAEASFTRAARFGDGWIMGGGAPDQFAELASAVDEAWAAAGRSGRPRKLALAYFSLGPSARDDADRYLHDYYGWLGAFADQVAASAAISEEMVRQYRDAFADSGCDELILFPCSTDLGQVELLADAVLTR
jgi:alkanesulfonate monooxygenase SsuD/methylene tetrahydromethanopterin reductase-like flavin-dependent oxidoreductase (luciferase family)